MKRRFYLEWIIVFAALAIAWPAFRGSGRDLDYGANFFRLLGEFFPPDFSIWREVLAGLFETAQISVLATFIAAILALPLAIGSSKKISPLALQSLMAVVLAFLRAIPSLIWALIAVAIIGPYPLAGVVALVFYSLGYLGKFFADAIDAQDFLVPQYLLRSGANPLQAFQWGMWPSVKRQLRQHVLWMLEYNIRSASIIGYVGAGGIGTYLHVYQEYGRWDRFSFVILVIFAIALAFEVLGRWLGRDRGEKLAASESRRS